MACLDTSFLVDFLRGYTDAVNCLAKLQESSEAVTVAAPSIFELIEAAELASSKHEEEAIRKVLSSITVLPLDSQSAWTAGEVSASLIMAGEQIGQTDILIAAIALAHGEKLLTRNLKYFARIPGLEVEDYPLERE